MKHALSSVLAAAVLSGCDPAVIERAIKPEPPSAQVRSVELIRLAQPAERQQLSLKKGERLSVDSESFAVIRYTNGTVVYVRPGSVVRIGSIFAELGAIFVKAKGAFRAETEFVTAGAQGTEYEVRVRAANDVTVVVLEGQVLCASKTRLWRSFVMSAGERADFHGFSRRERASASEITDIRLWVAKLELMATLPSSGRGWCCADGKVSPAYTEECGHGYFSLDENDARGRCAPLSETGYCCESNNVSQTTRQECRGYWATSETFNPEECRQLFSPAAEPPVKPEIDKTPPTRVEKDETIADLNALADILNQVVNHVNGVSQSLNNKNHHAAERSLDNARNAFTKSNAAFERLGTKKNRAAFHDAYRVAKEMREIQSGLLAASSARINLHKSGDIDGYNRSVAEHNQLISSYNQKINQLKAVTSELRK